MVPSTDVRMDDAPAETAAKGHRGQKRATVEPMEHAHKPKAAAAAKQSPQPQQQQQKRPAVESTARLTEAAAKQPVAATKQPQQQQKQRHAAETAAQPAAAAVTAVTSTAPAAALGQMLKMTDRGILRPNGTVDNTDWKCMGCGESEVNGTSSRREGCIVLLGCKCKYPKWQARKRPLLDL